ncbi:MAG: hypothetical protein IPL01_08720 [Acidobacteria bacterium]|nr:hypothetical protein [Acidobacteriota bacterium]
MSIDSKSNNDAAADGRSRETITGSVDRVTYHNEQNGYTILRLSIPSHRDPVTVTGNFSSVTQVRPAIDRMVDHAPAIWRAVQVDRLFSGQACHHSRHSKVSGIRNDPRA